MEKVLTIRFENTNKLYHYGVSNPRRISLIKEPGKSEYPIFIMRYIDEGFKTSKAFITKMEEVEKMPDTVTRVLNISEYNHAFITKYKAPEGKEQVSSPKQEEEEVISPCDSEAYYFKYVDNLTDKEVVTSMTLKGNLTEKEAIEEFKKMFKGQYYPKAQVELIRKE